MKTAGTSIAILGAALGLAVPASGDFNYAIYVTYEVNAEDFGGEAVQAFVTDLYVVSDDDDDVLLNVFNFNVNAGTCGASDPQYLFFQSFTGIGWQPTNLGGPFDTEALRRADSFVTIGGFGADARQTPGAGAGTGLDPNFGGNSAAAPGPLAGWYNASPPSLNGQVMNYDSGVTNAVLIARFASTAAAVPISTTFEITYNQGLGTPGIQTHLQTFQCPACCDLEGDLVPNTQVDAADLGYLLAVYGSNCTTADLDGDGVVGAGDIGLLLSLWGNSCFGFEGRNARRNRNVDTIPGLARTADLDENGRIDGGDLDAWTRGQPGGRDACDLDGDGRVDGADLGLLLASWSDQP